MFRVLPAPLSRHRRSNAPAPSARHTAAWALLLTTVFAGAAAVLRGAPTVVTFTASDVSNWSDRIADDGEGGSANVPGLTIQISNISDTGGTRMSDRLIVGHADYGDEFHALTTYEGPLAAGSGWKGMQVAAAGGAEFQIDGFEYWNYGVSSPITITVVGYCDGQLVASGATVTYGGTNIGTYAGGTGTLAQLHRLRPTRR